MPLLRIQRYKSATVAFVTYFVTAPSYDAAGQDVAVDIDPGLVSVQGEYAVLRTVGTLSTKTPVGPTATWIGGGPHPLGYTLSAPYIGVRVIGGTSYNCILVLVS